MTTARGARTRIHRNTRRARDDRYDVLPLDPRDLDVVRVKESARSPAKDSAPAVRA